AEDVIRGDLVTGVQTCALPISLTLYMVPRIVIRDIHRLEVSCTVQLRSKNCRRRLFMKRQLAQAGMMLALGLGLTAAANATILRSEERRVGKERSAQTSPRGKQ